MGFNGLDEDEETADMQEKVIDMAKESKSRRKAFAYWCVGGEEHKLKLKTPTVCQLEEKFKGNLLNILTGSGIPPLTIMLTVIQGAMKEWEHGVKYADIQRMFDQYCDEGGTQLTLFMDVIMPLMSVSGFFTDAQTEIMQDKMQLL